VSGIRKLECGLRPIGAYAYAPAGMRKIRKAQGKRKRYRVEGVRLKAQGGPPCPTESGHRALRNMVGTEADLLSNKME